MADGDDPRARNRWLPSEALPEVTVIHRDQSAWFGITRRPQVDSDRIPEERRDEYANRMIGRLGLKPALARGARADAGYVWVVPDNGFICLDVGGMCCNTSEVARGQGLVAWTSAGSGDRTIVHGLVPDGIEEIVLTATDGTTTTVPVKDNVYGAEMEGVFTAPHFAGPKGTVELGPWRSVDGGATRFQIQKTRRRGRNTPASSVGPAEAVSARKPIDNRTLRSVAGGFGCRRPERLTSQR